MILIKTTISSPGKEFENYSQFITEFLSLSNQNLDDVVKKYKESVSKGDILYRDISFNKSNANISTIWKDKETYESFYSQNNREENKKMFEAAGWSRVDIEEQL